MATLTVIGTVLYTLVALTVIGNFIRLFVEIKKLKEKKQTPLVGKTIITIILAGIGEVIVLFLLLKLAAILGLSGIIGTVIVFITLYYARVITAYLVTWGLWAIFVSQAKKKELAKINGDKANVAGQ